MAEYIIYDSAKIKEDVTMKQAAIIAGIPVSGNMILCPSHSDVLGKMDKRNANCQLNKNYFYCHACKASGDLFKMIKDYYRNYFDTKISFEGICKMIVDQMDDPKEYIISSGEKEGKAIEEEVFPLDDEILSFIGLKKTVTQTLPEGVASEKHSIPKNKECMKDFDPEDEYSYVYGHFSNVTLVSLFREDKEAFWFMVLPKIENALEYLSKNQNAFSKKQYASLHGKLSKALLSYYGKDEKNQDRIEETTKKIKKSELAGMFEIKPTISRDLCPF